MSLHFRIVSIGVVLWRFFTLLVWHSINVTRVVDLSLSVGQLLSELFDLSTLLHDPLVLLFKRSHAGLHDSLNIGIVNKCRLFILIRINEFLDFGIFFCLFREFISLDLCVNKHLFLSQLLRALRFKR